MEGGEGSRERKGFIIVGSRKIHPKYRHAIGDKVIESLDDIERYGRLYERQKDLDARYLPPPSAEKMRVPGAAYAGPRKPKVAAVQEEEEEGEVAGVKSVAGGKKGGKGKGKSKSAVKTQNNAAASEKPASVSSETEPELSFAAAVAQHFEKGECARPNFPATLQNGNPQNRDDKGASRGSAGSPVNSVRQVSFSGVPGSRGASGASGVQASARGGEFTGVCYTCKAVGHRSAECPEVVCFVCHAKGHMSRQCPNRVRASCPGASNRPQERCQGCDKPGVTVRTCPNCSRFFKSTSGNFLSGVQR